MVDTSAFITEFLNSSKAWRVWKVARTLLEPRPPERPSSLTEIKYADLLWGKTCHVWFHSHLILTFLMDLYRRGAEQKEADIEHCTHCFDGFVRTVLMICKKIQFSFSSSLYHLSRCPLQSILSWDGISYIDCPQQILSLAPCQVGTYTKPIPSYSVSAKLTMDILL